MNSQLLYQLLTFLPSPFITCMSSFNQFSTCFTTSYNFFTSSLDFLAISLVSLPLPWIRLLVVLAADVFTNA